MCYYSCSYNFKSFAHYITLNGIKLFTANNYFLKNLSLLTRKVIFICEVWKIWKYNISINDPAIIGKNVLFWVKKFTSILTSSIFELINLITSLADFDVTKNLNFAFIWFWADLLVWDSLLF